MLICLDENFQDRENCDVECITRIAKTGHTTHHNGNNFLLKSFHCHFVPLTILFKENIMNNDKYLERVGSDITFSNMNDILFYLERK